MYENSPNLVTLSATLSPPLFFLCMSKCYFSHKFYSIFGWLKFAFWRGFFELISHFRIFRSNGVWRLFRFSFSYMANRVTWLGDFSPTGRLFADWATFRRLGDFSGRRQFVLKLVYFLLSEAQPINAIVTPPPQKWKQLSAPPSPSYKFSPARARLPAQWIVIEDGAGLHFGRFFDIIGRFCYKYIWSPCQQSKLLKFPIWFLHESELWLSLCSPHSPFW
jgi:hypothetical protein